MTKQITPGRIRALDQGEVQFVVFTIDAWLTAGAEHGSFPGTIVMVNDETTGADAMVAYQAKHPGHHRLK